MGFSFLEDSIFFIPVIRCKIQTSPNIMHNDAVSLNWEKTLQNLTARSRGLSPENRKKMALWSRARTVSSLFNRLLQHPNNISSASAAFLRHFSTGTPLSFSCTLSFKIPSFLIIRFSLFLCFLNFFW